MFLRFEVGDILLFLSVKFYIGLLLVLLVVVLFGGGTKYLLLRVLTFCCW